MDRFVIRTKRPVNEPKEAPKVEVSATEQLKKTAPWVEKYRPKTVEEVVYQVEVISVLRKCLDGNDFPNLLFYGPPGTGKTSTILALAKQLFGDVFRERVLELNASDERGIQVVRDKVKTFARQTSSSKGDSTKYPPFKLIILDEADSMTKHAQAALRRTMEKHSRATRFCLICNYISRIIEPISSRCSKFRFKPLQNQLVLEKLQKICNLENVTVEDELVLEELIKICEGDLRKAITLLQSAFRWVGVGSDLTMADIYEVSGTIPESWLTALINDCKQGDYDSLHKRVTDMIKEGYSGNQFLQQLHQWIVSPTNTSLSDGQRSSLSEVVATADYRLLNGADECLQILWCLSHLLQQFSSKNNSN